jgi:hypothetical protein
MTKGQKKATEQRGTTHILDDCDDPTMTKESLVNNKGVCGCPVMGGDQPRFQTESQKKTWLRLRAKVDAKNGVG